MTPDVVWLAALTITGALSLWIGLSFGRHHHPCVQCGHPNAKCGRMCGKCEALARRPLAGTEQARARAQFTTDTALSEALRKAGQPYDHEREGL